MANFDLILDFKVREMEHFARASNAILNEYKLVRTNILNEKGKVLWKAEFKNTIKSNIASLVPLSKGLHCY